MMSYLRKRDKGFTLLEVMLVVIIIGIIAIIALPRLLVTKAEAENKSCDSNVQAIRTQLEQFYWNEGHYCQAGSLADFLDVTTTPLYATYWPEDSSVSSECPEGTVGNYLWHASTASNDPNKPIPQACYY
jgi:prepilin-type N-terminal cleavage/methylation domain-containing protein